jgi:hypothetical protein
LLQNVFEVDLDIKQKTAIKMPTVTQNDTVVFVCRIFDDGRIYNIQSGTTFTMTATRPDKVTVITEGTVTDENIVEFTLGTTELAVAGKVNTVVQVYDAEGRISTIPFGYYVLNDPSTDYIPSEHEETLIERVLGDGPQVIDDAEQAGDYAQSVADENKTTWLTPVATYEDIATTYVEPNHGDTVQVLDTGKIYRYTSGNWAFTQAYSSTQLNAIQNQLSEQEQQTQTLQHGLNVLSSDQASPLKVEFYGETRANLIPNFNSDNWNMALNTTVNSSNKITLEGNEGEWNTSHIFVNAKPNTQYLIKVKSGRYVAVRSATSDGTESMMVNIDGSLGQTYVKFITPSDTSQLRFNLHNAREAGTFVFEDIRLYEISQSTYDKIGVSLTDADVERMFPYVDSVQHVRDPYVKVSGANLLPPFYEWNLHENATVVSPYELRLDATAGYQTSEYFVKVLPNMTYTISIEELTGEDAWFDFGEYNTKEGSSLKWNNNKSKSVTFTTTPTTNFIKVRIGNHNATGTFTFSQPMLTLGSEPRPFTPKNDSYLYAYKVNEETGENEPLILAGNDDKKDNLFDVNYEIGKAKKRKWFEVDDVLDGSDDWSFEKNFIGFKRVYMPKPNGAKPTGSFGENSTVAVKYNGDIIPNGDSSQQADLQYISGGTSLFYMSISNEDTGFTDAMSPSKDLIKSYFYGYFYRGDGTTHSWRPIGDTDDTRLTTTLPTSPSPTMLDGTIQPYKLTYQLAEPIVEEVRVEGDLSIQGSSQISVGEGVIVREVVTPAYNSGISSYSINHHSLSSSLLKYKVDTIISIYKNGEIDNKWTITANSSFTENGARASISDKDFDSTATYTVTYEILDKHDFTTNLNEVVAHYNSSIKSSFQSVVSKQSDIATDQTILKRQMLDVLVRLDALEGTQ